MHANNLIYSCLKLSCAASRPPLAGTLRPPALPVSPSTPRHWTRLVAAGAGPTTPAAPSSLRHPPAPMQRPLTAHGLLPPGERLPLTASVRMKPNPCLNFKVHQWQPLRHIRGSPVPAAHPCSANACLHYQAHYMPRSHTLSPPLRSAPRTRPSCRCSFAPTRSTAEADTLGRLWSWEVSSQYPYTGHSCAFKDADNKPITFVAPQ